MARSFYAPNTEIHSKNRENLSESHYFHPASQRHYEMFERDGALYQARYQLNSQGEQVNRLEVQVDAILGSGNNVRSYLYTTPSGEWFQMPLAWYAKEQTWRMNPGYDKPNHLGFQRKITRECMFCHNAFPLDMQPGEDAHWQPHTFAASRLPHGIGCQRCHGPGDEHIQAAKKEGSGEAVMSSVVNPARLPKDRAEDVCLQCHLQPSSQVLSELVREGRGEFSFRPGEKLGDFRALLDYEAASPRHEDDDDRFEINHHGYRMHQSSCYIRSGTMSCTTCHDPHRKVTEENRVAHFRAACFNCHQTDACGPAAQAEAHTSTPADCVSCHMPKRRTQDVIHAVMTDHKIVAVPNPEEQRLEQFAEPIPLAPTTNVFRYHNALRPSVDEQSTSIYEAVASGQLGNQKAVERLETYVGAAGAKASLLALSELALALRNGGDTQKEMETLLKAVQLYPDHVQANLEMGMALAAAGMPERAFTYYKRAQQIGPPLPETHVGLGMSFLARNDLEGARREFGRAVELRPLYPEALLNLGIVYFALERYEASESHLRQALAADPTFVEANDYLQRITQLR